jgi:histidinol-phosphate aminotransferase
MVMTHPLSGPTPSPYAAAIETYRPPKPLTPTDLPLNANEGELLATEWLGMLSELPAEAISGYPSSATLEADIARAFNLDAKQVLVGTGGDDVVERSLRAYLCPGRSVIINDPSFVMLNRYAAMAGGDVVTVPWLDGALPVDDMLAAVDETTIMIVVVSPNNPTGLTATADDLHRLRQGAPHVMLLVDLAYGEFAEEDLTAIALSLPNTIVIRSFSKAWGLAGLRVGWAAGPAEVMEQLRAVGHPYPVAAPSAAIASHMLSTPSLVDAFVGRIRDYRQQLAETLSGCGARVTPSQGNFILAQFSDATWVRDALAGMGIAVRAFPDVAILHDRLRITVPGKRSDLERLCKALEIVLRPECVMIDSRATLARPVDRLSRQIGLCDVVVVDEVACLLSGDNTVSQRSWCVTTDMDTISAARQAGVLPLGLATSSRGAEAMLLAGAGRVLTNLDQLEELLQ